MKTNKDKALFIITGPTAVGKTDLCIELAAKLNTSIISADARQFYKELKIGTATPTEEQLSTVDHYFIGHLSATDYYNASLFEHQAIEKLNELFKENDVVLLTGGSGLYIDAICHGIDELPDVNPQIRKDVQKYYKNHGIEGLRIKLKTIDPDYYKIVDIANPNRMMRAIEVFLSTGEKLSGLRKSTNKTRSFSIKKIILQRNRNELFQRINSRVDLMVKDGLIEEMLSLIHLRSFNALNTVGYKELFGWIDNKYTLKKAIEKIKTNSRRYAKRQITWFNKYSDAVVFHPDDKEKILNYICNIIKNKK